MRRAIRLEFCKMRRLRTGPILALLIIAVAALSSISLFSGSTRNTFDEPAALPWAGLLASYGFMAAMTSPILTAILASRQTDIEHTGGWALASTAGYSPGLLCRAKLAALGLVLVPAVTVQSLLVAGIGIAVGIRVPLEFGPWVGYTALLFGVDLAFLALHIWLASVVENQLISVGIGMLGAFVAVFTLLMPGTIVRFVPWGYYAMILHAGQDGDRITYITPPFAWIVGFLLLVGVVFAAATRHLDRIER
ncbi:ABC transporter permease [Enemella sp. A6]|uniref:ABC transporter permease n=1 Tax=Enemella sp. A6 TaxID=3440152 RepID=UPI003EBEA4DD